MANLPKPAKRPDEQGLVAAVRCSLPREIKTPAAATGYTWLLAMDYLRIIILGIVQGISEFLPISSDGHLVVASKLFGVFTSRELGEPELLVAIILHLGTLLTILVVYWRRILQLLGQDRRVLGLIAVGTLPAAIVGLLLKEYFGDLLVDLRLTGWMLPLNGLMLLWIGKYPPGDTPYTELRYRQALLIGLCQALAPLPGISRSGTTIAAGLALGLSREAAATFSFLLAVPALTGAGVLAAIDLAGDAPTSVSAGPLLAGAFVSFAVGLLAIHWLLRWLYQGRLYLFAWWCIGVGILVLAWQFTDPGPSASQKLRPDRVADEQSFPGQTHASPGVVDQAQADQPLEALSHQIVQVAVPAAREGNAVDAFQPPQPQDQGFAGLVLGRQRFALGHGRLSGQHPLEPGGGALVVGLAAPADVAGRPRPGCMILVRVPIHLVMPAAMARTREVRNLVMFETGGRQRIDRLGVHGQFRLFVDRAQLPAGAPAPIGGAALVG
jgi:undecaprenyl-diphosphatase